MSCGAELSPAHRGRGGGLKLDEQKSPPRGKPRQQRKTRQTEQLRTNKVHKTRRHAGGFRTINKSIHATLYCFSCATSPCACATPSKKNAFGKPSFEQLVAMRRANCWTRHQCRTVQSRGAQLHGTVPVRNCRRSLFIHVLVETKCGEGGTVTNGFSSGSLGS